MEVKKFLAPVFSVPQELVGLNSTYAYMYPLWDYLSVLHETKMGLHNVVGIQQVWDLCGYGAHTALMFK